MRDIQAVDLLLHQQVHNLQQFLSLRRLLIDFSSRYIQLRSIRSHYSHATVQYCDVLWHAVLLSNHFHNCVLRQQRILPALVQRPDLRFNKCHRQTGKHFLAIRCGMVL